MEIKINLDENEIVGMIKEEWYKHARNQTRAILNNAAENAVCKYLRDNEGEFKIMFKEALIDALKTFKIRDLKQIEKMLNAKVKST
jgi:cytochrome b involved in lipid metabolism